MNKFVATALSVVLCNIAIDARAADRSYIDACAASLKMDEASAFRDEVLQYSILTYMMQSSKDEAEFNSKAKALTQYGFFDGTLNGAKVKSDALEKRLNLHWNRQLAEGYVEKRLSSAGATSFSDCVKTVFASDGVHISISESDEDTVTVHLDFHPGSVADERPQYKLKIFSNSDLPDGEDMSLLASGVRDRNFVFTRPNPADTLRVKMDVTSHGHTVSSATVEVPPAIKEVTTETKELRRSEEKTVTCSGNGDGHYQSVALSFPTKNPASEFDFTTITPRIRTHVSGDGVGGCGDNTKTVITTPSQGAPAPFRTIAAQVICEPGSRKDNFCDATGWVEASEVTKITKVTLPKDNGIHRKFRLIKS